MNDSKIFEKQQGVVHTWLTFKSPNSVTKYFSFEAQRQVQAISFDSPGVCTEKSHIENRLPSESLSLPITEGQYQLLLNSSITFCANPPIYDLIPNNLEDIVLDPSVFTQPQQDFNCVTASNVILQAANITTLANAVSPYDVKAAINNQNTTHGIVGFLTILRKLPQALYVGLANVRMSNCC